MSVFHDLIADVQLRKAIDNLGYEQPTPVQLAAIPKALEGKNLLVSSKTGSGILTARLPGYVGQQADKPCQYPYANPDPHT
jgi:ATP-dependent RNA helicase SrmB